MKYIIASASLIAVASAKDFVVKVGGDAGLAFDPPSVKAAKGDRVVFEFMDSITHDVASGSFDKPCQPDNKIYSGELNSKSKDKYFTVDVTDDKPIYFYCSIPSHCEGGMVGAINAPSSGNTLDAYKKAAGDVQSSKSPSSVAGGEASAASPKAGSGSSSGSSSASGSASAAASTGTGTATMTGTATGTSAAATSSSAASANVMQATGFLAAFGALVAAFL